MTYKVPDEYYFRIHHIRPRFKNDVENVLIFVSTEIAKISKSQKDAFMAKVNEAISRYPGNAPKTSKTINNWRTEISSLFGLIEYSNEGDCWSSAMANNLATNQDLVEFFKYFLFYFQYPGGHLKSHEIRRFIHAGIKFKPAKYILRLLSKAEEKTGRRFGITKAELTHCVFNDLRATRSNRPIEEIVNLIISNREEGLEYEWAGDVIRYAGDILDYMVLADLLVRHPDSKYYLNKSESETIAAFVESNLWFDKYDQFYGKSELSVEEVGSFQDGWFKYVNQKIASDLFRTNLFKYLGINEELYSTLPEELGEYINELTGKSEVKTKEVGDIGEYLIHGHECMRLKSGGKTDLVALVKRIPSAFAAGYDISSFELDETRRYVEVKTTVSNSKLTFTKFHLSSNEWKTAESLDGRYFIYRLMVSKEETRLFIIQDIVGKYKTAGSNIIEMTPGNGVEISFKENAGNWEELLRWKP
jgi:hypothetical protein